MTCEHLPSIERLKPLKKLDLIQPFVPKSEVHIYQTLLKSPRFQAKMQKLVDRTIKEAAEGGIEVYLYSPEKFLLIGDVIYGTRFAEGDEELFLGLSTHSAEVPNDHINRYFKVTDDTQEPRLIATFHSHPPQRLSGFFNADLENFEDRWEKIQRDYAHDKKDGLLSFSDEDMKFSILNGLLVPKMGIPIKGKPQLSELHFLTYFGRPTTHTYQAENFNRLSILQQFTILEDSGFRVIYQNFPLSGNKIVWDQVE